MFRIQSIHENVMTSYYKDPIFPHSHPPGYFTGNKANGWISKRVFQENKARQIFRKNKHFLPPDTHTCAHVCVHIRGLEMFIFRKFDMLCFLETPILRFALLPNYRQFHRFDIDWTMSSDIKMPKYSWDKVVFLFNWRLPNARDSAPHICTPSLCY